MDSFRLSLADRLAASIEDKEEITITGYPAKKGAHAMRVTRIAYSRRTQGTFFTRPGLTHIEPSKLFGALEESVELSENEREHLVRCEDCREVLGVFEGYISAEKKRRGV